ncbi:hypothetical protein T8A63_07280 [Sulfitobacter sp. OXR-159]|uniref:hypothetical protein n=1 Tax=Sulfitobacter sp. OXR-159 TaxID=3100174 RepID=UPI002AC957AB|nr:hypothetical protein [Sulfitobacter sp. OXR-159]WPZ30757.1 hypothetical protein T8A63_06770 [Sulfitobacter sp. OXR-159]WPZ30858.1 hypothetical protein T8A63_07280 [Sulfitobacter sp. OXR-159]
MSTETAAIIHSILYRKGGTHVTLDGAKYHFIDDDKGRQVAPVVNPDHIERFLQIPEGYKLLRGDTAASAPATPMGATGGAEIKSASVDGLKIEKGDGQAKAPQQEQGQQTEPEAGNSEPKAPEKDTAPQQPAKTAGDTALDDMDTDQLRAAFETEVGRKPHPQAKDDTMRAQIKAAREDKAGAA